MDFLAKAALQITVGQRKTHHTPEMDSCFEFAVKLFFRGEWKEKDDNEKGD